MQEHSYFQKALSDFTHEVASGGAIRHLTDLGYTVRQIREQLDFPTPYERIQKAVWERLKETGVILWEEPGSGGQREKAVYVQERDRFGRTSFRRVTEESETMGVISWKEQIWKEKQSVLFTILQEKVRENGEEFSYMSCDFGVTAAKAPKLYQEMLALLEEPQREYVEGLPWERRRVYHRMTSQMMEVMEQLCKAEWFQGECFFLKTQEKFRIESVF